MKGILCLKNQSLEDSIDEFEARYDDLCCCSAQLRKYFEEEHDSEDEEILDLNDSVDKVLRMFRKVIAELDMTGKEKQLESSFKAYSDEIGGRSRAGKFMDKWRKISKV